MPIQLDKILSDIANEKVLHPNYPNAAKKEVDDAWARVGKSNKLSVHEARSIFKVLQKKYEQEKAKTSPSWKLFPVMDLIHQKMKLKEEIKEEEDGMLSMEEDEEYEMLDVQEDEETGPQQPAQSGKPGNSGSDGESPSKTKSNKPITSDDAATEKDEKPLLKTLAKAAATPSSNAQTLLKPVEEKKLLNTLASSSLNRAPFSATPAATAIAAATLQKKGITMKKTTNTAATFQTNSASTSHAGQSVSSSANAQNKTSTLRVGGIMLEVGETIPLPESIKRKLAENQVGETIPLPESIKRKLSENQASTPPSKKIHSAQTSSNIQTATNKFANNSFPNNVEEVQVKQEPEETNNTSTVGNISLITIPGNTLTNGGSGGGACSSTAATVASTSTNGYSPRLEDIDFRNDIIFDAGSGNAMNGNNNSIAHGVNPSSSAGIINLGNFDNSLPPTFFKNLCNSSRHEALGLYVANVMNRLRQRSAAKLELGILRAIIDVQMDELEQ